METIKEKNSSKLDQETVYVIECNELFNSTMFHLKIEYRGKEYSLLSTVKVSEDSGYEVKDGRIPLSSSSFFYQILDGKELIQR